jgi:pimeloyl-ACP methyl ester carboxylesterase
MRRLQEDRPMGPSSPLTVDGAAIGEVVGDGPGPTFAPGRHIELPRRGRTFIRELPGPEGAPTVLLLHGWCATGGLNWFQAFDLLGTRYRVVAPDLRGHGRGLRSRRVFRIADCADDCAALLVELGTGPVIAVGYSMGGPVAQLLWRRHRDLVSGLVLCATSAGFMPNRGQRLSSQSAMLSAVAAARVATLTRNVPSVPAWGVKPTRLPSWIADETRRHDWRAIVEAGHSISTYHANRWIGEVDVPTAVVCTSRDRGVRPDLQLALADAIPGATVHRIDEGHLACAMPEFGHVVRSACDSVSARVARNATFT